MRTVPVDADHVARFEKTAKNVYRFELVHAATGREVAFDSVRTPKGVDVSQVERAVVKRAAERLRLDGIQRTQASARFADGKSTANVPALPPTIEAARAAGELDIPAELPVRLIRQALNSVPGIPGESPDSWRSRSSAAALDMGRKILIGAPDELILGIARGELTLTGSLRAGVTVTPVVA